MGWQAGDRLSVVEHFAGGRWHEGTNQLEQGALARAIRPDNGHYRSFFNREAHVFDGGQATVTLGYSLNLEDRHGYAFELWRLPRWRRPRLKIPFGSQSIQKIIRAP